MLVRLSVLSIANDPRFWGMLDVLFLVWYAATGLMSHSVPFLNLVVAAREHEEIFGNPPAAVLGALAVVLYASIALSAILLCLRRASAWPLVLMQTPLRLAFLVPSIFFIRWLTPIFPPLVAAVGGLLAILASEAWKVAALNVWIRRARKDRSCA